MLMVTIKKIEEIEKEVKRIEWDCKEQVKLNKKQNIKIKIFKKY